MSDDVVVEEWVDDNVVVSDTGNDSDSVTDCCCDKKRVTIDNGNWCVKLPLKNMNVGETVDFLMVLNDLLEFMPCFSECYDSWYDLSNAIKRYKADCLLVLSERKCLDYNGDVDYDGNTI